MDHLSQYNLDKFLDDENYILESSYKPTYSTKNENNKLVTEKVKNIFKMTNIVNKYQDL